VSVVLGVVAHGGMATKDAVTTTRDGLTALAVIVGGLFTYFKFVKGRIIGPRVQLIVTARPLRYRPSEPGDDTEAQ
jgi:hypothetical protein